MKRDNKKATQLIRGFLLGSLYEKGHLLTTAKIRREMRVSKATAKRDMAALATLIYVTPSKPIINLKNACSAQGGQTINGASMSDYFYSFSCACMLYLNRSDAGLIAGTMGYLRELSDEENQ